MKAGTDLTVFKPSNISEHMAGTIQNGDFYVCGSAMGAGISPVPHDKGKGKLYEVSAVKRSCGRHTQREHEHDAAPFNPGQG